MLKVKEKGAVRNDLSVEPFHSFLSELKLVCMGNKWEAIYYVAIMQYAIYSRVQEPAALYVEDFDLINDQLEIKRNAQLLWAPVVCACVNIRPPNHSENEVMYSG